MFGFIALIFYILLAIWAVGVVVVFLFQYVWWAVKYRDVPDFSDTMGVSLFWFYVIPMGCMARCALIVNADDAAKRLK